MLKLGMARARTAFHDLVSTPPGRADSLDGLRAFAAGVVVLCHTYVAPGGWVGVPVFFALSGYLITSILVREYEAKGGIDYLRFLKRRLVRLAPALLLVLVLFSAYDMAREGTVDTFSNRALPWVVTYIGNWKQVLDGEHALGLWGHTWSLAVEQQFYLLWPLVLLLALRFGRSGVVTLSAALLVASVAFRLLHPDADPGPGRATPYAIDALMVGSLLSMWERDRLGLLRAYAQLWPLAVAWLFAFLFWPVQLAGEQAVGPIVGVLASGSLIAALVIKTGPAGFLATRPLVVLGRLSYGVYLWHLPITMALNGHIRDHFALTVAVTVGSVIGALGSWVLVEHPVIQLQKTERSTSGRKDQTGYVGAS